MSGHRRRCIHAPIKPRLRAAKTFLSFLIMAALLFFVIAVSTNFQPSSSDFGDARFFRQCLKIGITDCGYAYLSSVRLDHLSSSPF